MCIHCAAARSLWLPTTRGSALLQRALGAATLLVAAFMLLWSASRMRAVYDGFRSSDLPLAGFDDRWPSLTGMTASVPSKQEERRHPRVTHLQLVHGHQQILTNNANTVLKAGAGADPSVIGDQQLHPHLEALQRANTDIDDVQRGPIFPTAGTAAPTATFSNSARAPVGVVSAAVDANTKGNYQPRPAVPRVALLFLVQGDGLLANEALWSAFLAGANDLELRQPPPAAAVHAATTVDLQALVGGQLKPPLRQHDEMAYQGYAQQHLLPVQPEAGEGPPPEPQARAVPPATRLCSGAGRPEHVPRDELPWQHFQQTRQEQQQKASSWTGSDDISGKAGQPQPQPQTLLDETRWRRNRGGDGPAPALLAVASAQDVGADPVAVPPWSRRRGSGLGRRWGATSSTGAGRPVSRADNAECADHVAGSASAAMTPSNAAIKKTTGAAATAPVVVAVVGGAAGTTSRGVAEASSRAMALEKALVAAGKRLVSELLPGPGCGSADTPALCNGCDLISSSSMRDNATSEKALTFKDLSECGTLCGNAAVAKACPCTKDTGGSYYCRCDGVNRSINASCGGECTSNGVGGSSGSVGGNGSSSLGGSVVTRRTPVAAYSATVGWVEAEVLRLLRQALRRVNNGSGEHTQEWGLGWWRRPFVRPSLDVTSVVDGVMVRETLLVQWAEREVRRMLALPPSQPSSSPASADGRRVGRSGWRLGRCLDWFRWLQAWWRPGEEVLPGLGGVVEEEVELRAVEEVWGTWSCYGVSGARAEQGPMRTPTGPQAGQGSLRTSTGLGGDGGRVVRSVRRLESNSSGSSGDGEEASGSSTFTDQRLMQVHGDGGGVGWRRFFRLYVHLSDPSYRPPDASLLSQAVLVRGTNTTRGYAQHVLVQAELLLIAAALRDPLTARLVLLSETSIPIRPAPHVWVQLMWEQRSRVDACRDINMDAARWHESMTTEHLHQDHWRKSSQWFAMTRHHAELAAADRHVAEAFRRFCYTRHSSLPTAAGGMGIGASTSTNMDASSASGSSRSSGIGPTQAWLRNYAATARPNMHDSGSDCDNNSDGDRRTVLSKMHEDLRQIWAPDLVGRKGTEAAVGPECLVLTKTRSSDIQNSTSCCSGGSPRPGRRDGDRRNIPDGGAGTGSGRGRAGLSQGSSGTDPWALHRVLTAGSRPCVSDEHYLPTLLASYGLDYQTDCLGEAHFVDWTSGGGWHPRSFLPSDIRGLEWESAAGGGGGPTARGSVDRRLGEEFLRWLEAGFSLFRGPTGPLGAAARPARLPDGRRLWGPDEGCWIRPNGCGGGGSQPSRHGASASLESLSHVFVMQSPGTKSLVATAELDPEPASTDEGKGKGRGVGAHEGAQERTGATVNEGTTVQLHAVQEGRAAPDVAAVAESPTLRSWLENLHYMPLGYRCHLFARKFPAVSARSSLHLALACPPRGLGLGAWCWRGQGLHPSPPQR